MIHVLSSAGATHVVELTPVGRAAVAVVVVDGPGAVAAVDACFAAASDRRLADVPMGRIVLGRWRAGSSPTPDGEEVIVCRRSPDRVEVHCHGGVAAVAAVIERLAALGCRRTAWQDWVRADERDPIRTAARVALADATTARSAAILLDQYHGALGDFVRAAVAAIETGRWQAAADALDGVLAWRELGQRLTTPWHVILAGPPNVGKSSLLNALAGYGRAIVSHLPGTTRDVVTLTTAIDGWPVQLADTAGLRDSEDALEAAGVALADAALADADLVLAVCDVSRQGDAIADFGLRPAIRNPSARVLHVLNKSDLIPAPAADLPAGSILTSALTGAGIAALIAAIGRTLVPHSPAAGAAVPFAAEQIASLDAARQAVDRRDARSARDALQALLPA